MIRVGVTGGIGSGKSYICNLLSKKGLPIYNCDREAQRLMGSDEAIRRSIVNLIGANAYIGQSPNKPVIAQYLFADKQHADNINGIVHPVVKADFLKWAEEQTSDIVFQECAILFESGFDTTVDYTVEVYANEDLRMHRAMARDNATTEQIKRRMHQQMPEEDKRERADFVIANDNTQDLDVQIDKLLITLKAIVKQKQNK